MAGTLPHPSFPHLLSAEHTVLRGKVRISLVFLLTLGKHEKETATSLPAAVTLMTCRHSPQPYSSRGCSPAEPRHASN